MKISTLYKVYTGIGRDPYVIKIHTMQEREGYRIFLKFLWTTYKLMLDLKFNLKFVNNHYA
jgi:hypothetical protein